MEGTFSLISPHGDLLGKKSKNSIYDYLIVQEIEILRHLEGVPNITRLVEVFPENSAFLMERAPGLNLLRVVNSIDAETWFTPDELKSILNSLLTTVRAIHARGVVHRDIKLANIMLERKTLQVTLIDFGLSTTRGTIQLRGSENYIWPRLQRKYDLFQLEDLKISDYFALGTVMFVLLNAEFPYEDKLVDGRWVLDDSNYIPSSYKGSDELNKIVDRMVCDPESFVN